MKIKKRKVSDIQSVIMAALSLMTVVISVTIGLLLYNRYEMLIRQNDIKDTQNQMERLVNTVEQYLKDKYKGHEIIVVDTHSERLDRALAKYDIVNEMANGVDIQIDVLGIARKQGKAKLFFIEAKKTKLTLRDLGQLWSYCKLVDPEEAFLLTSADLGSLRKLLVSFKREDLLDFGDGKRIKKMQVGKWDVMKNTPEWSSLIPKM